MCTFYLTVLETNIHSTAYFSHIYFKRHLYQVPRVRYEEGKGKSDFRETEFTKVTLFSIKAFCDCY